MTIIKITRIDGKTKTLKTTDRIAEITYQYFAKPIHPISNIKLIKKGKIIKEYLPNDNDNQL